MGAALWGFSLMGPQAGVAAADTSEGSSVSERGGDVGTESDRSASRESGTSESDPSDDADREAGQADSRDADADADAEHDGDADDADADDGDADADAEHDGDADDGDAETKTDDVDGPEPADTTGESASDAFDDAGPDVDLVAKPIVAETISVPSATPTAVPATVPAPAPAATTVKPTHPERVAKLISDITASAQAWIDSLIISESSRDGLEWALYAARRTFLNQAPTVAPVQITGVIDGPITGSVGAVDPDGDRLIYRLVTAPTSGTVRLNPDGTFTYTPGNGFNGVDTFVVRARDLGLHLNLLDWFRPVSTSSGALINQGAIKFDFRYVAGAEYWTTERKAAMQRAANALAEYFRVTKPVVITYDVTALDDPNYAVLGEATSALYGDDDATGFLRSVVQQKIITGEDNNETEADGFIWWNFGNAWAYGDVIGEHEYDFRNTAMHEMLHSFGFLTMIGAPGTNTGRTWTTYDSFLTSADGAPLIDADYNWRSTSDRYVDGLDGGLYFSGANAVAAYGKPVPIYSPHPFAGNSVGHLDGNFFPGDDFKLMNHKSKGPGPGNVRTLSDVELGILKDLGFTTAPRSSPAFILFGFIVLLRRRKVRDLSSYQSACPTP